VVLRGLHIRRMSQRSDSSDSPKWPKHNSEPRIPLDLCVSVGSSKDKSSPATPIRQGAACSSCSSDAAPPMGMSISPLAIEAGSPRLQSLSLEVSGGGTSARGVALEDSWKGEILPGFLFLGDRVTASDSDRLEALQITHILNATEDVSNFFEGTSHFCYMRCPIKDRSDAAGAIAGYFPQCVEFLNACRAGGGRVLVHCRAGVSRSATLVIGYLMQLNGWDLKTALHFVDTRRFVQPNSGFIEFLIGLERSLFGTCSVTAADFGYAPD